MRPIQLYFAGSVNRQSTQNEIDAGMIHRLLTYAPEYRSQISMWFEFAKEGDIFLDSGAFSAWTKDVEIDVDEYAQYCLELFDSAEAKNRVISVVNVDVIPGKKGQTQSLRGANPENKRIIETAAKQGFKNMLRMIKNGVTPIHVFHQGEDFKWLDRIVDKIRYIGISPANDVPTADRKRWMATVFDYLDKKNYLKHVHTHGFAVWAPDVLLEFPWTSCDAATWRVLAGWGKIYYPMGGYSDPQFDKMPILLEVSKRHIATGMPGMTENVIKRLEDDGLDYEELQDWKGRSLANIRYFLEFEKWLNKQKKDMISIPTSGGLF